MSFRSRLAWHPKLLRSTVSIPFGHWLHDRGSLTERLQTRGNFSLHVLRQGLAIPTHDEAIALGIRRKRLAWIREVALLCDGRVLVFAHSVLPCRPRGPVTGWLARLGNRSLGAMLFANAGFVRGAITCKRLDQRHRLFQAAIAAMQPGDHPADIIWARRSSFSYGDQSVLVTECFSPALLANL